MIPLSPQSLLNFMRSHKYEADIQSDTQQVYTIFKIDQAEYPLFLRIFENSRLLQLLVFIPTHLRTQEAQGTDEDEAQQKIIADLARLLHLFNKELDIPGFGMDETVGVVFYRFMLPAPHKKIEEELLLNFLKSTEYLCKTFCKPIQAVSSGQAKLDDILAKTKEMGSA